MSDLIEILIIAAAYVCFLCVFAFGWVQFCMRFPHTLSVFAVGGIALIPLGIWGFWPLWAKTGLPDTGTLFVAYVFVRFVLVVLCLTSVAGWYCWGRQRIRYRRRRSSESVK